MKSFFITTTKRNFLSPDEFNRTCGIETNCLQYALSITDPTKISDCTQLRKTGYIDKDFENKCKSYGLKVSKIKMTDFFSPFKIYFLVYGYYPRFYVVNNNALDCLDIRDTCDDFHVVRIQNCKFTHKFRGYLAFEINFEYLSQNGYDLKHAHLFEYRGEYST